MMSPVTVVAALLSLFAPADKATAPVRVTSVESRVDAKKLATIDPKAVLRTELEQELEAIDWQALRVQPFQLSAVLVDAESVAKKGALHASVTVRLVLCEPNGTLLGQVSAKAAGDDRGANRVELEASVLEAASKRAASALPEAVRRARAQR